MSLIFQSLMDLSLEPLTILPSFSRAKAVIQPLWPLKVFTSSYVCMLHTLAVVSFDPLTKSPDFNTVNVLTWPEWPRSVVSNWFVLRSHIFIVQSAEPLARRAADKEARQNTPCGWASMLRINWPGTKNDTF